MFPTSVVSLAVHAISADANLPDPTLIPLITQQISRYPGTISVDVGRMHPYVVTMECGANLRTLPIWPVVRVSNKPNSKLESSFQTQENEFRFAQVRGSNMDDIRTQIFDLVFKNGPQSLIQIAQTLELDEETVRAATDHGWFVRQGETVVIATNENRTISPTIDRI